MIVGLADLRDHLKVVEDDEDRLIAGYAMAAEQQIQSWLGRPIYARPEDMPAASAEGFSRYQMVATEAIRVSIMQMVERLYTNRGGEGGVDDAAVPPLSVRAMLSGYRVFCEVPAEPTEPVMDPEG